MVILKPNFGGTYQQAVQRVGGTIAGSVIEAILAAAITTLARIETFTTQIDRALRDLADTVRSGRRPASLPAFDASRGAAHDAIRELMPTGATKPATEPSDQLNGDASYAVVALGPELDRLEDEVVGMSKAVELVEHPCLTPGSSAARDASGV